MPVCDKNNYTTAESQVGRQSRTTASRVEKKESCFVRKILMLRQQRPKRVTEKRVMRDKSILSARGINIVASTRLDICNSTGLQLGKRNLCLWSSTERLLGSRLLASSWRRARGHRGPFKLFIAVESSRETRDDKHITRVACQVIILGDRRNCTRVRITLENE